MVELEELLPLIGKISKYIAADYPDVEESDMHQELCLFVIKNGKSIKNREQGGNPNWLLKRVAHHYAKLERTQQLQLSMQYNYRLSDVQRILETAWASEEIINTYVPDDAVSLDGNDSIEVGSDVRAALERISKEDRIILFRRYALKEVPTNSSYERKQLNRATKNLVYALNSYRGQGQYTGKRRVISNSTAQAIVSGDW